MRTALQDTVASWRAEAERVGAAPRRGRRARARAASGSRVARSVDDLALRVAQLEHRLRLLERDSDAPAAQPEVGLPPEPGEPAPAFADRPPGEAPVPHCVVEPTSQRSISRLSEIGRVATRHGFGYVFDRRRRQRRHPARRPRPAAAGDARRARADVRQVRPAALDASRPRAARHRRGAAEAPGRRHAVPARRTSSGWSREELGLTRRAGVRRVRAASRSPRRRSARCTARRCPNGERGRRQGAAARRAAADRVGPQADALGGAASRASASGSSTSSTPRRVVDEFARSIRGELDYQQEARNAETFRRNFADDERIAVPRVWWRYTTGRLLTLERLEGVHVRDLELEHVVGRGAARARLPDDRRLDDDDLPARVLPRRPASREHPPARRRPAGARRLRSRRPAHRRGHGAAHAAVRRRGDRERRGAPAPARRPRRPVPAASGRTSSARGSRRSTTATTGRASRTSTRSR